MYSIIVSFNPSLLSSYNLPGMVLGTELKENTRDSRFSLARILNTKQAYTLDLKSECRPLQSFHIIGQILNAWVFSTERHLAMPGKDLCRSWS